MNEAAVQTHKIVQSLLAEHGSNKKIDDNRYALKQGSTFILIDIISSEELAMLRCTAQVIKVDSFSPNLAKELLQLNNEMRFGAFSFDKEGQMVLFSYSLLGGVALHEDALRIALRDVSLISDRFDNTLAEAYQGQTMRELAF